MKEIYLEELYFTSPFIVSQTQSIKSSISHRPLSLRFHIQKTLRNRRRGLQDICHNPVQPRIKEVHIHPQPLQKGLVELFLSFVTSSLVRDKFIFARQFCDSTICVITTAGSTGLAVRGAGGFLARAHFARAGDVGAVQEEAGLVVEVHGWGFVSFTNGSKGILKLKKKNEELSFK